MAFNPLAYGQYRNSELALATFIIHPNRENWGSVRNQWTFHYAGVRKFFNSVLKRPIDKLPVPNFKDFETGYHL